jgi:ubiquitin carboxyl-terminal hydrolase 7
MPATDREVFEENYGGEIPDGVTPTSEKSTTARMLVYIREAAFGGVLVPLTERYAPLYLSKLVSA